MHVGAVRPRPHGAPQNALLEQQLHTSRGLQPKLDSFAAAQRDHLQVLRARAGDEAKGERGHATRHIHARFTFHPYASGEAF